MSRSKYLISLYSFSVLVIISLLYIAYSIRNSQKESNFLTSLFSLNHNGKLNYSEIITKDTCLIYKNIELQLSENTNDSLVIIKYLTNTNNAYSELIKFTLNSFLLMKISFEEIEYPNDSTIKLTILIKNFNNLPVLLIFKKENSEFSLINILNLNEYIKQIDKLNKDYKDI